MKKNEQSKDFLQFHIFVIFFHKSMFKQLFLHFVKQLASMGLYVLKIHKKYGFDK